MALEARDAPLHWGRHVSFSHYARTYAEFIKVNAAKALGFRANFILMFLLDIVFYATNIWTYELVMQNLGTNLPWTKEQFMLYVAFIMLVDWIHTFFVGSAFWQFTGMVRQGQLDYVLLRPLHPLFTCFLSFVRFDCILNIIPATAIIIYYGSKAHLTWEQWALLPLFSILSSLFIALIDSTITTMIMWTQEGIGIHFIRFQMNHFARWPDFMYRGLPRKIFTYIVPACLYFTPYLRFLFDYNDWYLLALSFGLCGVWLAGLFKLWSLSVRQYESASS